MAKKIKKDLNSASIGDIIEYRFHCSDPNNRTVKNYLIVGDLEHKGTAQRFPVVNMDTGQSEKIRIDVIPRNTTYKIIG